MAPWEDLLIRFDSIINDWKTENVPYTVPKVDYVTPGFLNVDTSIK